MLEYIKSLETILLCPNFIGASLRFYFLFSIDFCLILECCYGTTAFFCLVEFISLA